MAGRGVTVWLTGLPASGKSTVARHLSTLLTNRGVQNEVLDGDSVRANLSKGLGFTKADRDSNVQRIGFVCDLLTRNGVVAIAAVVSPYAAAREAVKRQIGAFVEVHVATPLAECEKRDRQGRYAAARRGEITSFTGIDDPYEAPTDPALRIDCSVEPPELCAARVLAWLEAHDYVAGEQPAGPPDEERLEQRLKNLGYS
jgi:adenylylsulfate kinase